MLRSPALAAGLLFVLAAAAFGQVNISNSPGWQSWYPRVAIDPEGNVNVAWIEVYGSGNGDLFFSRLVKSTGLWSAPVNLSESGRVWSGTLMACSVDIDDSGNVYVIWSAQNAVMLRVRTSGGWGSVSQIGSGSGLDGSRIAVTGGGDLFCVWWSDDGTIITRARINGSWEGAQSVSESGRRAKFPDIAVGTSQALVCWVEKSGEIYQAAYRLRSSGYGSGWNSSVRLAPGSISQQHPVAEYANGTTPHVVFTPVTDPNRIVQHCAWTGSGFGSPQNISDETMLHYPSLAEKSGSLYAVWQVGSYGAGQAVYQNVYSGGKWGGQSAISGSNGCTFVDVAVDSAGKANIVWDAGGEIIYSLGASGGGGTPTNVAPIADFAFSPSTGIAPLTVTFDGSASRDPDGTIARYDWIFGDGDTGSGRTVNHTFETRGNYSVKLTVVDNLGKPGSKIQTLAVLGLYAPLNVDWTVHLDKSMFQTRSVTEVTWAANPANDAVAAITKYRVYRKRTDDDDSIYLKVADVDGTVFAYRDTKMAAGATYVYAVSALDASGHESPLSSDTNNTAEETDAKDKATGVKRLDRR
ncbi:MAG: PKD domain-containing protein [Candidatus Aminicenantes bacterium]|nr:PKD domain-containing protein [Candidatus Aminicenantes bacterium]